MEERRVCGICSQTLNTESCSNAECQEEFNKPKHANKGETFIVEMDSRKDLKIIIEKNWQAILEYKNELSKMSVTDICNTQSYLSKSLAQNSIMRFNA